MRRHLVNENEMKVDSNSPLRLSYGFIMDGVQPLRNITRMARNSKRPAAEENALNSRRTSRKGRSAGSFSVIPKYLTVYPDPELDSFAEVKQFYLTRNEYLNLNVGLIYSLFNLQYTVYMLTSCDCCH